MRMEQEHKLTEDARASAEQDAAAQRYVVHMLQVCSCHLLVPLASKYITKKIQQKIKTFLLTAIVVIVQEKYENAMASLAQMEKRAVMAESMLEATLQSESGQSNASCPR